MTALTQAYHLHAVGVRRAGAWLGAALLLLAMTFGAMPELGVGHLAIELLSWAGCALGGAVLLPEATTWLTRFAATGGGVLLIVAAQWLTSTWPQSGIAGFSAAVLMGVAGLAKAGALVRKPDVARASRMPPEPDTDPGFKHPSSPPPLPKA